MGFLCFGRKKKQNKNLRDSGAQTYKGPQKTYKGPQGSNYQPTLNRRKSFYLLGCIDCAGLYALIFQMMEEATVEVEAEIEEELDVMDEEG
jgi:hypothetical protein